MGKVWDLAKIIRRTAVVDNWGDPPYGPSQTSPVGYACGYRRQLERDRFRGDRFPNDQGVRSMPLIPVKRMNHPPFVDTNEATNWRPNHDQFSDTYCLPVMGRVPPEQLARMHGVDPRPGTEWNADPAWFDHKAAYEDPVVAGHFSPQQKIYLKKMNQTLPLVGENFAGGGGKFMNKHLDAIKSYTGNHETHSKTHHDPYVASTKINNFLFTHYWNNNLAVWCHSTTNASVQGNTMMNPEVVAITRAIANLDEICEKAPPLDETITLYFFKKNEYISR